MYNGGWKRAPTEDSATLLDGASVTDASLILNMADLNSVQGKKRRLSLSPSKGKGMSKPDRSDPKYLFDAKIGQRSKKRLISTDENELLEDGHKTGNDLGKGHRITGTNPTQEQGSSKIKMATPMKTNSCEGIERSEDVGGQSSHPKVHIRDAQPLLNDSTVSKDNANLVTGGVASSNP